MDYDKLIAPAAAAMRPSGIRKFFDLAADIDRKSTRLNSSHRT